jgi:hypothetical protein
MPRRLERGLHVHALSLAHPQISSFSIFCCVLQGGSFHLLLGSAFNTESSAITNSHCQRPVLLYSTEFMI